MSEELKTKTTSGTSSKEVTLSPNFSAFHAFGASLNLLTEAEGIANLAASTIRTALNVTFGAVVLRDKLELKKRVFGHAKETRLGNDVLREVARFLSEMSETSVTDEPELSSEIEIRKQDLPKIASLGLHRILLVRLRTMNIDYGIILAGKNAKDSFTEVQCATLETLAHQTAMALHRIQLKEKWAAKGGRFAGK
ncbi:hypothetical protein GWO43_04085 [candidate division KSB1 bacterium]|nr:hypothetical protein [candidate division KSB1 bacterium]NIS23218.1 hypothetical protein [candidate division KSB1 bacterium]NIT70078.1 hypothetical protein [candidate division KSB1 bacterium]NIU23715.1 hypothetical protein [candidate division KSB1 bacterium]NIW17560.1 hypothetical protein [candidate division KSB1 bacterium]